MSLSIHMYDCFLKCNNYTDYYGKYSGVIFNIQTCTVSFKKVEISQLWHAQLEFSDSFLKIHTQQVTYTLKNQCHTQI